MQFPIARSKLRRYSLGAAILGTLCIWESPIAVAQIDNKRAASLNNQQARIQAAYKELGEQQEKAHPDRIGGIENDHESWHHDGNDGRAYSYHRIPIWWRIKNDGDDYDYHHYVWLTQWIELSTAEQFVKAEGGNRHPTHYQIVSKLGEKVHINAAIPTTVANHPATIRTAQQTVYPYQSCAVIVWRCNNLTAGCFVFTSRHHIDSDQAQEERGKQKRFPTLSIESEAKQLAEIVNGIVEKHQACRLDGVAFRPTPIPPRDPREVDALLDNLGMMLAAAAAAPPPRLGITPVSLELPGRIPGSPSRKQPAVAYTWTQAVDVAHTVHVALLELQHEAAHNRFRVHLSPAQVRRLKALLHWVKWIYDRNAATAEWAATGIFFIDPYRAESPPVPPPPEYPLNGPIPASIAEIPWPWTAGPISRELLIGWEAFWEGSLNTAVDTTVLAAQIADAYYFRGCGFLVITAGYAYCTGELTPLAWQVLSMSPIKYNGVPVGSLLLAGITASEAIAGYEVRAQWDQSRWVPIKLHLKPLESLRDVQLSDPTTYPWQRIGKGSMACLLSLNEIAAARGATRRGAELRPVLADAGIAIYEGQIGAIKEVGTPRPVEGGVLTTLEALQPTMQGWYQVTMEVLKTGDGVKARYLHPETRKPLFLLGRDGYHAYKHYYELYPFGKISEVRSVKVKVDREKNTVQIEQLGELVPADRRSQLFRSDDNKVFQLVDQIDPQTGAPLMQNGKPVKRPAEMPGLRDLFYDHPQLKDLAAAFEATVQDGNYDPMAIQQAYVRFMNGILEAFARDRKTFTAYNSFFKEHITAHLIEYKGQDLYITLTPQGGLMNAMLLSSGWKAADVAIGYKLQAGRGFEYGVTARMTDLIDNLLVDPLKQVRLPIHNQPVPESALQQMNIQHEIFKTAIREDALRIYSLGGAAFREEK